MTGSGGDAATVTLTLPLISLDNRLGLTLDTLLMERKGKRRKDEDEASRASAHEEERKMQSGSDIQPKKDAIFSLLLYLYPLFTHSMMLGAK